MEERPNFIRTVIVKGCIGEKVSNDQFACSENTENWFSFPKNKFLTTLVMNRHRVTMLVYALQLAKYKLLRYGAARLHGDRSSNGFFLSHTHAPSLVFLSSLSITHTLLLTLVSPSQANCHWNQDRFMFLSGIGRGEREDVVGEETREEEEKDGP